MSDLTMWQAFTAGDPAAAAEAHCADALLLRGAQAPRDRGGARGDGESRVADQAESDRQAPRRAVLAPLAGGLTYVGLRTGAQRRDDAQVHHSGVVLLDAQGDRSRCAVWERTRDGRVAPRNPPDP